MARTRTSIIERLGDGRIAVAIFVAVAVAGFVALPHLDIQGNHPISDGSLYGTMARHPGKYYATLYFAEEHPFRVLTPWMVWALSLRPQIGFALFTVLGIAGSAAILYLYARTFVDRAGALRAVAFFVLVGDVLFLLLDPWLVDGLTMLLSILGFLLVRRRHLGWATLVLCLGVANQGGVLLVVATLVIANLVDTGWDWRARLLPFVGLPVLVYVVLHYTPLLYGFVPPAHRVWSAEVRQAIFDLRRQLDGNLAKHDAVCCRDVIRRRVGTRRTRLPRRSQIRTRHCSARSAGGCQFAHELGLGPGTDLRLAGRDSPRLPHPASLACPGRLAGDPGRPLRRMPRPNLGLLPLREPPTHAAHRDAVEHGRGLGPRGYRNPEKAEAFSVVVRYCAGVKTIRALSLNHARSVGETGRGPALESRAR